MPKTDINLSGLMFFSYFTYSGDVLRHLLSLNMIAFII